MTESAKPVPGTHSPSVQDFELRFDLYTCSVLSIAVLRQSPENRMLAFSHQHDQYEFILPHTPIPGLQNEQAVYFGQPGMVYPVSRGRQHGLAYELYDVSHTDLVIDHHLFETIMDQMGIKEGREFNYEFPSSANLRLYIRLFQDEFRGKAPGYDAVLQRLAGLLCVELIRSGTNPDLDDRHQEQYFHPEIKACADYLMSHCTEKIKINELCGQYGLSKYHFIRTFTHVMGDSPYSFLMKARMSKARMLLTYEDAPVSQVSEACGFSNTNHFSDVFRQKIGCSPTEYRQTHQKNRI